MSLFKPGDAVLVVGGPRRGEVTTVTSGLMRQETICVITGQTFPEEDVHELGLVSLDGSGDRIVALPEWLLPLLDDSKRAEYLQDLNLGAPSEGVGRG